MANVVHAQVLGGGDGTFGVSRLAFHFQGKWQKKKLRSRFKALFFYKAFVVFEVV